MEITLLTNEFWDFWSHPMILSSSCVEPSDLLGGLEVSVDDFVEV